MNHEICEPRWSAIADRLIRWRFPFLGLAFVIGVFSLWFSGELVLERRLESMFRSDDLVLKNYQQLQEKFGGNEVILVVFSDEDFWNEDRVGMANLAGLHEKLLQIDGIRGVMDLSVVDQLITKIERPMSFFANASKQSGIFSKTPMATAMLDLFVGTTHSENEPWLAVACLLEPNENATYRRSNLIRQIREAMRDSSRIRDAFLVGEPVMVEEGFELIERDAMRLGWISSIVLTLLMLVVCRNLRWTILTLLVVHWSLTVTRAICVVAGWELTMVSSMLVAIVTVIGIATTMHWLFGYQQDLRSGKSPNQALQGSLRKLIRPIAWACITDALGFAALMAARIEPVRDYGFMMTVASLVTLLAIMLLGPGLASIGLAASESQLQLSACTPSPKSATERGNERVGLNLSKTQPLPQSENRIEAFLKTSLYVALKSRRFTFVFLFIWLILVILGSSRLEVETDFLNNFKRDSTLVQGYSIVESKLEGAGVWDILVPAPAELTSEYLAQIADLENELRKLDQGSLTRVVSLAGAESAARRSPVLAQLPVAARLAGMRIAMPSFFDSLVTPSDGQSMRTLRIMLRSSDRVAASAKLQLIYAVERCVKARTDTQAWKSACSPTGIDLGHSDPVVTGYYVLLSHLVQSVVADQWICLAIATIAIWFALRLAIGDWLLAAVALVPNTLPALGSIAALGLMGMKMNLGAAMIAAVSIGLSVDSSLHYLIDYQRSRKAGLSCVKSLERSQTNVGLPVIFSTLALVLGFASLATSDFLPTVAFGTLAAITMSIGLIGNLWWLPVLVEMVDNVTARGPRAGSKLNND